MLGQYSKYLLKSVLDAPKHYGGGGFFKSPEGLVGGVRVVSDLSLCCSPSVVDSGDPSPPYCIELCRHPVVVVMVKILKSREARALKLL